MKKKKRIFYYFQRAFIEANRTIFLEDENPTLNGFVAIAHDKIKKNNKKKWFNAHKNTYIVYTLRFLFHEIQVQKF